MPNMAEKSQGSRPEIFSYLLWRSTRLRTIRTRLAPASISRSQCASRDSSKAQAVFVMIQNEISQGLKFMNRQISCTCERVFVIYRILKCLVDTVQTGRSHVSCDTWCAAKGCAFRDMSAMPTSGVLQVKPTIFLSVFRIESALRKKNGKGFQGRLFRNRYGQG